MTEPRKPTPTEREPAAPGGSENPAATDTAVATESERQPAEETTIGTGTSIALGCVAGTVLLVIIGLLFLLVVVVFG